MQGENSATDLSNFDVASMDTVTLAIAGGVALLFTFAWIRIFSKAGYHWALGLLMLIPVVNLVMMFVLAFGNWPVLGEVKNLRKMEKSVETLSNQLPRRAA